MWILINIKPISQLHPPANKRIDLHLEMQWILYCENHHLVTMTSTTITTIRLAALELQAMMIFDVARYEGVRSEYSPISAARLCRESRSP